MCFLNEVLNILMTFEWNANFMFFIFRLFEEMYGIGIMFVSISNKNGVKEVHDDI